MGGKDDKQEEVFSPMDGPSLKRTNDEFNFREKINQKAKLLRHELETGEDSLSILKKKRQSEQ